MLNFANNVTIVGGNRFRVAVSFHVVVFHVAARQRDTNNDCTRQRAAYFFELLTRCLDVFLEFLCVAEILKLKQ